MSTDDTTASPPPAVDLKLDSDEDQPRRLVGLPSGQILAYGGDDGTISLIRKENGEIHVTAVRRFDDDAIRAVAVSKDGQRVALGFDSGGTQIYVYDDYQKGDSSHPFVPQVPSTESASQDDNLLSQSDGLSSSIPGETSFAGPCFDVPVRDLHFLTDLHLAIATESGLCIIHADGKDTVTQRYLQTEAEQAHDAGGVRGVAVNTDGSLMASLGMDGRLCIWNLSGEPSDYKLLQRESTHCVTKRDVGEILGADAWDRSTLPAFLSSTVLALPGAIYLQLRLLDDNKVVVQDQPETSTKENTPHQGHLESIVAMAASPVEKDGYMVTSGRDGRVVVWEIEQQKDTLNAKFVRQLAALESAPTYMLWDKAGTGEETLYVALANGMLVTFQGRDRIAPASNKNSSKASAESSSAASETSVPESEPKGTSTAPPPSSPQPKRLSKKNQMDKGADSDDDVAFDDSGDAPATNRFVDDEAADDESVEPAVNAATAADDKEATTEFPTSSPTKNYDSEDDYDLDANINARAGAQYKVMDLPEPQAAFAPSSTPLDLSRRFMCWNHIGSITHHQGEETRSTVDIDFTDSAFRRPITFTDNMGFILGSLGEDGGIFASDLDEDDDLDEQEDDDLGDVVNHMSAATKAAVKRSQRRRMSKEGGSKPTGSTIYFHRFETFGALRDKDWYIALPNGERALGCACGEGWAAAITSRRFLRLFSSGGNQGQVLWLDGEPVTMAGRGRFVAVFYHESAPLPDGTQKLGYLLFDATTNCTIAKDSMSCISTGSSLSWVGFSNDESLLAMDTDGMVSMLVCSLDNENLSRSWEWMPVLDTVGLRKSADDSYWPTTMYDAKLICVPLKGGTKHPDAGRRPVTTALGLRLPLARGTLTKSNALEELSVRANIALTQKKVIHDIAMGGDVDEEFDKEYSALSAQVDKVTLKMFAATVEAGKLERALDLVERLHLERSYELAMTIADSHRKLVDLIEDAKDRKFGEPPDYSESPEYDDGQSADDQQESMQRITPDANHSRKTPRAFDDEPERQVRRKAAFA